MTNETFRTLSAACSTRRKELIERWTFAAQNKLESISHWAKRLRELNDAQEELQHIYEYRKEQYGNR